MTTVIIYCGPHYHSQRHQFDNASEADVRTLKRMCARHNWAINIKNLQK